MKRLAVINENTHVVENIIVPPSGAQAWFVPTGFYAILSDMAKPWDIYDPETGSFTTPEENRDE